jgi:transcriptional regulator with XRE-family HTH domain
LLPGVPRKQDPQRGLAWAIRKLRTEAGLTQNALARLIELDPGQFSRIEKGEGNPQWGTVRRIAIGLGVTLVELAKLAEDFERRRR